MDSRIKIRGKDDRGPWTIYRIEGSTVSREENAQRFGVLADYVREFVERQDKHYNIEFEGPSGRIFEDSENRVLFYIVNSHNELVRLKKNISKII